MAIDHIGFVDIAPLVWSRIRGRRGLLHRNTHVAVRPSSRPAGSAGSVHEAEQHPDGGVEDPAVPQVLEQQHHPPATVARSPPGRCRFSEAGIEFDLSRRDPWHGLFRPSRDLHARNQITGPLEPGWEGNTYPRGDAPALPDHVRLTR